MFKLVQGWIINRGGSRLASPQVEKGFVRISNELYEAILSYEGLTGVDLKIIFFIIRMSYGWGKKKCQLSYGDISKGCSINRASALKSVRKLKDQNIVFVQRTYGDQNSNIVGLNKNYEHWINNVGWK